MRLTEIAEGAEKVDRLGIVWKSNNYKYFSSHSFETYLPGPIDAGRRPSYLEGRSVLNLV